ncbi:MULTISPECIES: nickel/cobalt transporter [unclassified Brucella]|uniref:nickel/cobalt transporter n=1 Tax=unclassified Brucella TaxID=2632610 RepID=UPI0012AD8FA8|nr:MULTISPECIES: nickel/cobalt transporter [unclassified Brucella]MRN43324.1 delayed-early response protein/equilibrative nucleoside transporter [Brucella sp. 09RB8913]MRN58514.1 delayed-early response protein/equilibrative nucleoside transporter [Brucella sp. 09RB8918]
MRRTAGFMIALCLTMIVAQAYAQSSLGIGANEVAMKPTGPFAHIILWMNEQQRSFYLAMTTALKAMREDPLQAAWGLVGLSFIYGIFHAVGPGHGKAVISSYMIANETALRRGIFLSFISSLLQAIMAVAVVGLAWLVLRGTGISMNQTARYMEIASFALVLFFGLWLLVRKLPQLFRKRDHAGAGPASPLFTAVPQPAIVSGPAWQGSISQATRTAATGSTVKLNYKPATAATDHIFIGEGNVCAACGNAHIVDPSTLGDDFNWKTAWSAIFSVGLRPCSGALIVLTFALLNGLMVGGLLSVFAMALGTFITVAVLATLAVTAKNTALRFAGSKAMSGRLKAAIEVCAALFITLTGALLLSAALVG